MDKAIEILSKIKERKIEPKSKWRFLLKDYMVWLFFVVAIAVGAMAFSVIIFLLKDNDWDIYEHLDKSFASYLLLSLPYVWIVILAVFSFLAYLNYKNTRNGYKLNPVAIVLVSVLLSVALGGVSYGAGFGRVIDSTLSENIPYYENMIRYRQTIWSNPERGLLSGTIIEIEDDDNFYIEDSAEEGWEIKGEDILWRRPEIQEVGEKVKIIGEKENENTFIAEEVRPWIGRGKRMQENKNLEIRRRESESRKERDGYEEKEEKSEGDE